MHASNESSFRDDSENAGRKIEDGKRRIGKIRMNSGVKESSFI